MALQATGTNDYLELSQAVWAFNADFTYCLWFIADSITQVGTIFELDDAANSKQMTFRLYNDELELSGWAGTLYIGKSGIVAGTRYFITITGQGTALRIIFNEDFAGATTATATRPTGNFVSPVTMFGSIYSEGLIGRIRDFRYYNRKLSDNEIKTIYKCTGKDSIVQNLQNRFLFTEKAPGQTLSNFSDIKNNASKAVSVSGSETSTALIYVPSFLESKVIN